jgi:tetratricopeptide (TPR) repeat protein
VTNAKSIFEELMHISDSYSPLIGLAYCYAEQDNYQKAIEILKKNILRFKNTAYFYEIEFLLADLLAKNKQITEAKVVYESLIKQNPNRSLYSLSTLRNDLINSDTVIVNYLKGEVSDKFDILKSLNLEKYNYNTFPYLASLAMDGKVDYESFLKIFLKNLEIENYLSVYGIYKLSLYMCGKMDFERARKVAALTLRYSTDISFNSVLKSNFEKLDWLYKNKDMISTFTVTEN